MQQGTFKVGQTVCVSGKGTAATVHVHAKVTRETRTMWVVGYGESHPVERRYRKDSPWREVGAGDYGGTGIYGRCQR